MGAVELVRDLLARGVRFEAVGDRVRWADPGGHMTPERVAALRAEKGTVLNLLASGGGFLAAGSAHLPRPEAEPPAALAGALDAAEERAALAEHDGGLSQAEAEALALAGCACPEAAAWLRARWGQP